ncbi:hypothetical protein C0J45_22033 [Silurus meridionalis]|nr:hypothetical protein C0J45_22033 [Silurus meridionalis]
MPHTALNKMSLQEDAAARKKNINESLLSETLCSSILEAEVGDDVTIWCKHELKHTDQIFWFKHTNDSVPLLLGCKQISMSAPSQNCYFFTESNRMVMSVQGENTSLTITAVNVSDTGLYYCSSIRLDQIIFGNSTSLRVEESNKTLSNDVDRAKGDSTRKDKEFTHGSGCSSCSICVPETEVVCHATGFYPKTINITWQKDGKDMHEDVELREMLPNQDGSFQKRSILKVSAEKLQKHNYTCVIEHSSLEKEMVLEVPNGSNKLQTYIMKEDLLV